MGTTAFSATPHLKLVASSSPAMLGRRPALNRSPSGLRILREFEPGASPGNAGRMVISGTMADVCAELDRLTLAQGAAH